MNKKTKQTIKLCRMENKFKSSGTYLEPMFKLNGHPQITIILPNPTSVLLGIFIRDSSKNTKIVFDFSEKIFCTNSDI